MDYKTLYSFFGVLIIINMLYLVIFINWIIGSMVGLFGFWFMNELDKRDEKLEELK